MFHGKTLERAAFFLKSSRDGQGNISRWQPGPNWVKTSRVNPKKDRLWLNIHFDDIHTHTYIYIHTNIQIYIYIYIYHTRIYIYISCNRGSHNSNYIQTIPTSNKSVLLKITIYKDIPVISSTCLMIRIRRWLLVAGGKNNPNSAPKVTPTLIDGYPNQTRQWKIPLL